MQLAFLEIVHTEGAVCHVLSICPLGHISCGASSRLSWLFSFHESKKTHI